ncbi:MAG: DUF192 domain-containing protein [Candidatus Thiodiazotropha sp. (ex. Lucinisca nassula)]|uniref:DUF192 domain-containing protein n=1 Tax=Candidatus Thiodiazotropha sp. LNASS1 TaxID=3096260 RepID=UPI0028132B19|nr:DUF192 domain-containing protein [Candidatus Thiodiazotropha sp. (ex. Lucinisca nassula)]
MKRIRLKKHATEDDPAKGSPALEAWVADSYLTRLRGLLGKKRLDDSDGLLLERCASVHTFWMRYPLDLVFMDKKGKVVKCQEGVKPFRTASARGAYYTLELNQGVISKQGISESDHFYW